MNSRAVLCFLFVLLFASCAAKRVPQNGFDPGEPCLSGTIIESSHPSPPRWTSEVPPQSGSLLLFVGISSRRLGKQEALADAFADAARQIATYIGIEVKSSLLTYKQTTVSDGRSTSTKSVQGTTSIDLAEITGSGIKEREKYWIKRRVCLNEKETLPYEFEAAVLVELSESAIGEARQSLKRKKEEELQQSKDAQELKRREEAAAAIAEQKRQELKSRIGILERAVQTLLDRREFGKAKGAFVELRAITGDPRYESDIAKVTELIEEERRLLGTVRIAIVERLNGEVVETGFIDAAMKSSVGATAPLRIQNSGYWRIDGEISFTCRAGTTAYKGYFCHGDGWLGLQNVKTGKTARRQTVDSVIGRDPLYLDGAHRAAAESLVDRVWPKLATDILEQIKK